MAFPERKRGKVPGRDKVGGRAGPGRGSRTPGFVRVSGAASCPAGAPGVRPDPAPLSHGPGPQPPPLSASPRGRGSVGDQGEPEGAAERDTEEDRGGEIGGEIEGERDREGGKGRGSARKRERVRGREMDAVKEVEMRRNTQRETETQRQSRAWVGEEEKVDSEAQSRPCWAAPSQGGFLGRGWGP